MGMYQTKRMSAENGDKTLFLAFAVGAAGAVGAFARQQGFTRTPAAAVLGTAGQYTINLDQKWQQMLALHPTIVGVTTNTTGSFCEVTSVNLLAAQPNIVLQFRRNSDMAAADLPNPSTLELEIVLKDSTA